MTTIRAVRCGEEAGTWWRSGGRGRRRSLSLRRPEHRTVGGEPFGGATIIINACDLEMVRLQHGRDGAGDSDVLSTNRMRARMGDPECRGCSGRAS